MTPAGRRLVAVFGALLALGLLALSLLRFAGSEFRSASGWVLYLLALAAAAAASLPFGGRAADPEGRVGKRELAALAGVLVAGAAFRFFALSNYPWGIWFDEAENTMVTQRILGEPGYAPVFVAEASKMPALAFYLFAPFVKVFTGPLLGVRVATTVAGLLALVAVWLVGRELAGPRVAILAAGLLAVSRWHVTFSRFGMAMIFTTLVPPLVFLLALRSQRRESPRAAVGAGLVLGLGIQLYYSMIVLPVVVAAMGLRRAIGRGARSWRTPVLLAVLTIASAAFAYAPLGLFARHNPAAFTERFRATAVLEVSSYSDLVKLLVTPSPARAHAVDVLTENVRRHALMFHVRGDPNGRHNLPGAPMLDPVTGVLFAAGLLLCVATAWAERSLLLLLWLFAFLAAGVLSVDSEAPQAARTLGTLPAVVLMAALPLAWAWRRLEGAGASPLRTTLAALLPLALLGAAAAHSAYTFFELQRYDLGSWAAWSTPETKVARVVKAEGDGAAVFVPPPFLTSPAIRFVLGRPLAARAFLSGRDLPLDVEGRAALVFLTPADPEGRKLLGRLYPNATFEEFRVTSPAGRESPSVLTIARVARSDLEALRSWRTTIVRGKAEDVVRSTRETSWDWSQAGTAPPFEARVRGRLQVLEDGLYRLVLSTSEPARLSLDGGTLAKGSGRREVLVPLAEGMHDVALDVSVAHSRGQTSLAWVMPRAERPETIPPPNLVSPLQAFGGLLGTYVHGEGPDGTPVRHRIDPNVAFYFHEIPVPRPFAIRWTGTVEAPVAGRYRFSTRSLDDSTVLVDGREVVRNPGSLSEVEGAIDLTRGPHALDVTFRNSSDYAQVYLSWTPPGGTREIVPTEVLRPPKPVPRESP